MVAVNEIGQMFIEAFEGVEGLIGIVNQNIGTFLVDNPQIADIVEIGEVIVCC